MNLLMTLDRNYVPQLNVMLFSALHSDSAAYFDVYLLHDEGLSEADVAETRALLGQRGALHLIQVDESGLADAPTSDRYPKAIYYRVFAAKYLPDTLDRVLYLDPDIVVRQSLQELYEMPMGTAFFAAASHIRGFLHRFNELRLDMDEDSPYINSGVMLMNLEQLRQEQDYAQVFDYIAEHKNRLILPDQDIISGLYSRNVNIDVFLKGHSGDTIRVDRIGRASESIIHPALTMVLAVQPEVLNGLMSNNTFRGRGLTARFLYSMPKSTVGSRSFSTEPIPEGVRVRYQDLIEAILSSDNEQQPISLDDGAGEVLETLFNEVEGRLKGDLAEIPDWAGKFVGSVLRISGILHVMKYPKDSMFDPVDRETMENAVTIGRYFLEHAKAAYSLMGADAVNKNARYLLSAIKRERLTEFSRRDAMRLCRRFKTAEGLQPVLDRLCEYGYLAAKPLPPAHGAGRKPSEIYLTNPAVLEDTPGVGG